jgi:protein-tyrosine phosphatase
MTDAELASACEFIKDRLYFASIRAPPRRSTDTHFFNVDNELVYEPFFDDFGPVNLAMLYRFCCHLADKLRDRALADKKIVYYTSHDQQKRANGAYLITSFAIIHLKKNAEEAYAPFVGIQPPFAPFKDVYGGSWNCTIIDCCRAIYKAQLLGWLNFETFNVQEYEYYERVENGDLNAIVPGRFVAFSGPAARRTEVSLGPEDYVPILKRFGVTAVVRLNKKVYDRKKFLDAGIKHYDMYFIDGGNPTDAIIKQYLDVVENERGAIGIHCKAGLGRTGVLNACYLMKHYRLSANELIAWMRCCRPGTVIGPQQQFLKEMEPKMWREGDLWRQQNGNQPPLGGPDLAPIPEGWYDQPDSRCDQDEDMVAAQAAASGAPQARMQAAPAGGSGYGYQSSAAYAGYQKTYTAQAAPRTSAPRSSGYSTGTYGSSGYGHAGAVREAPTRQAGYGSSMAGRSVIGTSPYSSGARGTTSGTRAGGYARAAPAPAGGYGSSRSTGNRYY